MMKTGWAVGMLWLKVKMLGAMTKLCKLLNKTIIYQSKTGLKEINPRVVQSGNLQKNYATLRPYELYLGIDFLKDEISLINVPIAESPHFGLMKDLLEGGDGRNTEYVKRMLAGALDERYEILAFYLDKNYFRRCFERTKHGLETDSCAEVIAYEKNGRYYIHDGKHRAALCALLGMDVKCNIVGFEDICKDFNIKKVAKLMHKKTYLKHKAMFDPLY